MESLVYANKPATMDVIEANIVSVIHDLRPPLLEKVTQNWTDRNSRGDHMPQIIFID